MKNLVLIGTTSIKFAARIGQTITIEEITHGEPVKVQSETHGNKTVLIIDWNHELYEIETTTEPQTRLHAVTFA